jgi:hypothetical protein
MGAWERGRSFRGWEGCGTYLTYIGESLQFVLVFRVGPRTNRLVGCQGKRDGKRAAVRKETGPRQGIEAKS